MKKILLILLLFGFLITYAQERCSFCKTSSLIHYHVYGNKDLMELHSNGQIYKLKNGVKDGVYVLFYDEDLTDTAMIACVKDGFVHGEYCFWHPTDKYLEVKANYNYGSLDGERYLYFWAEGDMYTNIELFRNDTLVEFIQMEW